MGRTGSEHGKGAACGRARAGGRRRVRSGAATVGTKGKGRNRMGNAAKVMLVDDDESLHVLMRRIVEDAGYAFCAAFDGEEGLALLADEKPDLLLLDVMMPGMNGFDVCRRMREEGRRIPIVSSS